LSGLPLQIGTHLLRLDVTDGTDISSDDMILTIENSAPHAAAEGAGVFESPATVPLGGSVSDYDGDVLVYRWLKDDSLLYSGTIPSAFGGDPVRLPVFHAQVMSLGEHIFRLEVSDGVNAPVASEVTAQVIDTTVPTLSPVSSSTILWPPNHRLVDITIDAHAFDSQGSVTLAANVSSNEPQDGTGDGDTAPDMTPPHIDNVNGIIRFQLRAERSGLGNGRIYTVIITATDESNNTSTATLEIIVPHDKKK
jgi:hypothetical protein